MIQVEQDLRTRPSNPYCVYSSYIFLTNTITAFLFDYNVYATIFFLLFVTSFTYHSHKNIYTNVLDKMAILAVVLYGGHMFFQKCYLSNIESIMKAIVVVAAFIFIIIIHYHNRTSNDDTSQFLHCIIHTISSIGHHIIIFM